MDNFSSHFARSDKTGIHYACAGNDGYFMSLIHVATAVNDEYLLPLAVLLYSLTKHLDREAKLVVHLLHVDLKSDHLRRLGRLADIHSIRINGNLVSGLPGDFRFPKEAAFPLLLADVLPDEVERVLFLDADMLVCDDVSLLWATTLHDHVVAAVRDAKLWTCASPRAVKGWREAGIPSDLEYINSGMMLIHLPRWRAQDVTGRAIRYLQRNRGNVDFFHQEALNYVLWNQRLLLSERWNVQCIRSTTTNDSSRGQSLPTPGIIHFSGRMKPWRQRIAGPFQAIYQESLEQVVSLFPCPRSTMRENLLSFYDIRLRDYILPVEDFFWRHRWL